MGKKVAKIDAFREIEGTALTTTYANVGTATANDCYMVQAFNTCNDTIIVSLDGGTTDHFKLDASEAFTLDLRTNHIKLPIGTQIQAKDAGSTPASGSLRITLINV